MLGSAIMLLVVGLLLLVAEAFIPSGGILGLIAAGLIVTALVLAFRQDVSTGLVFVVIAVVLTPIILISGFRIFPHTPIGKRLILKPTVEAKRDRGQAGIAQTDYSSLKGRTGKAVTPLRPSGIIEINDRRYSAVGQCEIIEQGEEIVVVEVKGNNIIVDQKNA